MKGFNMDGWQREAWNPRPLPHELEAGRFSKDGMELALRVLAREGGPVYAQAKLTRAKPPLSRGLTSKVLAGILAARWVRVPGRELWVAVVRGAS